MVTRIQPGLSAAAFEVWVQGADPAHHYELIGGEVSTVVSNSDASEFAFNLGAEIRAFVKQRQLGRVKGADGGYQIGDERYIPDVSFISYAKQPDNSRAAYYPQPPDLAVEVISDPSKAQEQNQLRRKLSYYLQSGVVVWVVNPDAQQVEVHVPGQALQVLNLDDTLKGEPVLPGFTMPVRDVFGIMPAGDDEA